MCIIMASNGPWRPFSTLTFDPGREDCKGSRGREFKEIFLDFTALEIRQRLYIWRRCKNLNRCKEIKKRRNSDYPLNASSHAKFHPRPLMALKITKTVLGAIETRFIEPQSVISCDTQLIIRSKITDFLPPLSD